MKKPVAFAWAILCAVLVAPPSLARVCDYRPSALISKAGAGAAATASALGQNSTLTAAGFYTLSHAGTGSSMLSTAVGGSTAGTLGTVASVASGPVALGVAAVGAVALIGFEGACYFTDDRITDQHQILAILTSMSAHADPSLFRVEVPEGAEYGSRLFVKNKDGKFDIYELRNLYIENGLLKNRDWLRNTTIGRVSFVAQD